MAELTSFRTFRVLQIKAQHFISMWDLMKNSIPFCPYTNFHFWDKSVSNIFKTCFLEKKEYFFCDFQWNSNITARWKPVCYIRSFSPLFELQSQGLTLQISPTPCSQGEAEFIAVRGSSTGLL